MLKVGLRVVRGPDWKWDSQDGGEGHCGTVVELGKSGSLTSPDKTVVVQWDSGSRTNYRVGYLNAYDLLVVDNAPAGVKHPKIICDGCRKHGIDGMRWKCETCPNYDLCTQCYTSDKHDINHNFQRFETANSVGVPVPPRACSQGLKIQLKGVFIGAKVVRGPDWVWFEQDGGEGKTGRVTDIRGWLNESGRSVANVVWTSGSTNIYRLGHTGKVDLKYVEYAVGGYYYKDHLPVLGIEPEQLARAPGSPSHLTFKVGDKVKVLMEAGKFEDLQKNHGLWNEKMRECIGKVGTVQRVTDKGDIKVMLEGCNKLWAFHPAALIKATVFGVGDIVKLCNDEDKVKNFQIGHGLWADAMKSSLGKIGKVIQVYKDGDLRVCFKDAKTWTLNPMCVTLISQPEGNNMESFSNQSEENGNSLTSLLSSLQLHCSSKQEMDTGDIDKIVREAAHGHIEAVKDFILKFPDKIDATSSGKTCLQLACHQGHKDLVKLLISYGAKSSIADQEGDTALHYAAFGDQAQIMEILLKNGADINAVNRKRCTALHVAVNKQYVQCVRRLLYHKCDVNVQDWCGDTALHDAIGKGNVEITDWLCNYEEVDLTLKNNLGFNVLHQAALKGKNAATEKLLNRARELVDLKKDDGFAALHLACLNGHRAVAETLLILGHADVNIQNNRKQTPLLLAVSQGLCSIIELLLSMEADLHAVDEEGESALHLVLIKRENISTEITETDSPVIYSIHSQIASEISEHAVAVAIACYLVREGCSLVLPNAKGETPLDLVAGTPVQQILHRYVMPQSGPERNPPMKPDETSLVECSVCSESVEENVFFEPCGHKIACEDCAGRVKKCLKCGIPITKRVAANGKVIPCRSRHPSAERVRYLETKIQEIEDANTCSICMERKKNVMFLCGHSACDHCSQTLGTCHMCRETITRKINFY